MDWLTHNPIADIHGPPFLLIYGAIALGLAAYLGKMLVLAVLLPIGETSVAKLRVFRYPVFLGSAFAAAPSTGE